MIDVKSVFCNKNQTATNVMIISFHFEADLNQVISLFGREHSKSPIFTLLLTIQEPCFLSIS